MQICRLLLRDTIWPQTSSCVSPCASSLDNERTIDRTHLSCSIIPNCKNTSHQKKIRVLDALKTSLFCRYRTIQTALVGLYTTWRMLSLKDRGVLTVVVYRKLSLFFSCCSLCIYHMRWWIKLIKTIKKVLVT